MIKSKIRNASGISLVSLVVTTIAIIILANISIYNVKDNLKIGNLKGMKNDVSNLRDKISAYYAQNGKIPASIPYTNIDHIRTAGVISETVDTGDFLVIDLSAIDGLTLNYGKDFEEVKVNPTSADSYTDLYIINEASHNIFYVAGITIDNITFYTNYTSSDIDSVAVDLRYVDNVQIPDGYTYVEGNKETGIKIKSNIDDKTYTWVVINQTIAQVPDGITVDNEDEFLDSVNRFGGYYQCDSDNTVIFIEVIEKWSPTYDIKGTYKDKNGDTVTIPAGYKVSMIPGEDTIDKGLVVQKTDGSKTILSNNDTIIANPTAYYGSEVTGYNAGTGVSTWRIFYTDSSNIYLIADDYISYNDAKDIKRGTNEIYKNADYRLSFNNVYNDYEGSSWILGQTDGKYNSLAKKWLNQFLKKNPSSININIRAVAYMMDTGIWSKYVDDNLADYAIGGPTLEMFCASYTDTHPDRYIECEGETNANGYQIKWSGDSYTTDISGLTADELNGIYIKSEHGNAYAMWIASPSASNSRNLMRVYYNGYVSYCNYDSSYPGLRPIVCLKSNINLEKVSEGTYKIIE